MPIRFEQKPGLVVYLTVGDPDLATTRAIALAAIDAGADVLELGVPFSDPLADGPVIERASHRAVANGTTLGDVLALARDLRAARPQTGLVLFSYLNPILRYGRSDAGIRSGVGKRSGVGNFDRFTADAKAAGVDGVLATDLTIEEAEGGYLDAMHAAGLAPIFLAAPTSTDDRLRRIAAVSQGFVYAISRVGITGTQQTLASDARSLVERLRRYTTLPIALGFGVSNAAHVAALGEFADAAVIGSAIVGIVEKSAPREASAAVARFIEGLRPVVAAPTPR
ncbi:MAG TPA: tryptophan synthase subunit alpha [Acidobacteriaceae bacterium]|nr:tryptophan synthase subunit alpha [Acidobacteriaceae bacterium]